MVGMEVRRMAVSIGFIAVFVVVWSASLWIVCTDEKSTHFQLLLGLGFLAAFFTMIVARHMNSGNEGSAYHGEDPDSARNLDVQLSYVRIGDSDAHLHRHRSYGSHPVELPGYAVAANSSSVVASSAGDTCMVHMWESTIDLHKVKPQKEIGRGAKGKVLYAQMEGGFGSDQDIAIKVRELCRSSGSYSMKALAREQEVINNLPRHPNIIWHFSNYQKYPGAHASYMCAMEMMDCDLHTYITENAHFAKEATYEDVVKLLLGIARGMKCLHDHQIVHRDLKPSNVLLDEQCVPKIGDFDDSKLIAANSWTNFVHGTEEYLAPELWLVMNNGPPNPNKKYKVTLESDVYSYGKLAYDLTERSSAHNMARGESLKADGNTNTICMGIIGNLVTSVPSRSPEPLRKLIEDCCHFNVACCRETCTGVGRPSFRTICERLELMLKEGWMKKKMPWTEEI